MLRRYMKAETKTGSTTTEQIAAQIVHLTELFILVCYPLYLFSPLSGTTEAEGPKFEEAGAGDGQPQLQKPTAGQEGGAATRGARCQ